jgi:hypothetical protein
MPKQNCWEFFNCGRELGGKKAKECGVCPTAVDTEANGLNHGKNGGRICWAIAGSLCDGEPTGTNVEKHKVCFDCEFYKMVVAEEGFLEYRIIKPSQMKE